MGLTKIDVTFERTWTFDRIRAYFKAPTTSFWRRFYTMEIGIQPKVTVMRAPQYEIRPLYLIFYFLIMQRMALLVSVISSRFGLALNNPLFLIPNNIKSFWKICLNISLIFVQGRFMHMYKLLISKFLLLIYL